ncbi:MAG: hypothetical protein ACRD3O_13695, partial [Terriglobia bacterium]
LPSGRRHRDLLSQVAPCTPPLGREIPSGQVNAFQGMPAPYAVAASASSEHCGCRQLHESSRLCPESWQ